MLLLQIHNLLMSQIMKYNQMSAHILAIILFNYLFNFFIQPINFGEISQFLPFIDVMFALVHDHFTNSTFCQTLNICLDLLASTNATTRLTYT
jgi:hypothetical protein